MRHQIKRVLSSPVFITSFAFALRMLIVDYAWRFDPVPVRDRLPYGYELGQVARSIAAGNGFSSPLRMVDTGPTAWFTPIYPYLVAGIFKLWGIYSDTSHMVIETIDCAFAAFTIIPIYAIGRRTFGQGVGVGAAWAWVFLPTALFFPITWVWDTTMAALFLALIFWATLALRGTRGVLAWAGYGVLWAVGGLVNPSVLSVFPFLLGWLVWDARKRYMPWMKLSAATVVLFSVCLVPWTVRNYQVFHKFIVLRSNFGLELWLGNNPNVPDSWAPWLHPNDNLSEAQKYERMGEIPFMAEKQKEAFQFIRTHPRDVAYFTFHRFVQNWLGITDSPSDSWSSSPIYVRGFLVMNSALSLLCLLGALFACRTRHSDAIPYAFVLLIFPLVFYVTHASLRYRFPMDPIMMVLAANGVAHLMTFLRIHAPRDRETEAPFRRVPLS